MTRELKGLAEKGYIEQPFIPEYAKHNAHMYYIKVKDQEREQSLLISSMKEEYIRYFIMYRCILLRQEENLEDFTEKTGIPPKKVNGFCVFPCTINFQKKTGSM